MKHILFLHGALGAQSQFDSLKEKLGVSYHCHSLDFFGHGHSSFSEQFGIDAFANQVTDYVHQYELEGCHVFGYSMGGYVALFAEHAQPGLFSSIMTLGTKFNWTPESSKREASFLDPIKIQEKVPAYAESLKTMHGDQWVELCEKTTAMMRYLGDMPLLNNVTLSEIKLPVRLAIGDSDKMVTLDETTSAFRQFDKGSFLVMPTTPHPIEQVNMDRLAYKIEKFVES